MNKKYIAAVAAALLAVSACGGGDEEESEGTTESGGEAPADGECAETRYVPYVFHVPPTIPFISVFNQGLEQAARDFAKAPYCIETEFLAPDTFDTAQMAQILETALAKDPVALIVSYPDTAALEPGLTEALDRGIPVITVNAGGEEALALGVLAHVGADEVTTAIAHGERFAAAGAKNVMCVNDNPGTNVLTLRCDNIRAAMEEAGGTSYEFPASNADPVAMKNAIIAGLRENPDTDAIGGVYSGDYQVAIDAIEEAGLKGEIMVGIYDFEPGTTALDSIKSGDVMFASSQGPYLQGYVPLQMLALFLNSGQVPSLNELVNSGGLFVDASNVDEFLARATES